MISLLTWLSAAACAQEESTDRTIKWYRANFPPVTIVDGPNEGLGFFDKVTHLLENQLPDYEHIHQVANFKRIIIELKSGKNVCCPSLYKTRERETFISFSVPAMVVLPNVLITRKALNKKFQPYLDRNNRLKLTELLADERIHLGISNGRKYAGGIDDVLS
ncbi:MAG: hypothetical protein MI802_21005, partial [Desulfobacterales bacterium]|nr:hypothetical protein [Desulfobacterales bacterium]